MRQLIILSDYDEVLFPLLEPWVHEINRKYGTSIEPNQITDWVIFKFFPSLTKDEIYSPLKNNEFWEKLKPKKGAVEYAKKLVDSGHKSKVVTATQYENVAVKMKLLYNYFPFVSNVHITDDKQSVIGDMLWDDATHNLIGGNYKKVLFEAPHNRDFDAEANGMIRVRSVEEAYKEAIKLLRRDDERW